MAKGLVVTFESETSTFGLSKVDRDRLYGKKERVVVDDAGEACAPAHLTTDGAAIIPSGGLAYAYVDEGFDSVERSELQAVDANGQPLSIVPSTLGVPQPAAAVDARRVLDHFVTAVYQLDPEAVGPKLLAALDAGQVFETRFNYRDDYADSPCFLVKNDKALFALVASASAFEWVAQEAPAVELEPEAAEADAELDFNMI
jgi:hypothetical protein